MWAFFLLALWKTARCGNIVQHMLALIFIFRLSFTYLTVFLYIYVLLCSFPHILCTYFVNNWCCYPSCLQYSHYLINSFTVTKQWWRPITFCTQWKTRDITLHISKNIYWVLTKMALTNYMTIKLQHVVYVLYWNLGCKTFNVHTMKHTAFYALWNFIT